MTAEEIKSLVDGQREYFYTGATLDVDIRLNNLRRLREAILKYEIKIEEAIRRDLGKSKSESYMCEVGLTLSEISYMLKHTRRYARELTVPTPLANFAARSYKKPSPYGVTLIMSPWNYPFLLTMEPLVDALAAGNTAIVKPSAYSPATSEVIAELIAEVFDSRYVAVVTGGRAENTCLLNEHFDYIFFTGSQAVGREVMSHASKYLTPVTLELGGKSPCIVTDKADVKLAAKRIVFGKFLNCGQTCVAPDYILVHENIKDKFIDAVRTELSRQYGEAVYTDPFKNENYGKIINEKHLDRLTRLIDKDKTIVGGFANRETCQLAPTIMVDVTYDDAVMQEEIFGPIMPILTFNDLQRVVSKINSMQHPLALYIFTSDKSEARYVIEHCGFGGGCINDTIMHLATSSMGFGGFGESGMGSYHGKAGFDTFSHYKSISDKKTWIDMPMRYQPYKSTYDKLVKLFLR